MKTNEIATATLATLKTVAKESGVKLPAKANKADIVKALTIHFAPKDEVESAKDNALTKAKASKKAETPNGKLALVFDSLKSLHDAETKVTGIEFNFWKASKNSSDVSGVTIRFNGEIGKGFDSALVSTIRKSLKSAGVTLSTMTIRKTGSACLWVK